MLGEPVGGDHIGICRVSDSVFRIVRPAPVLHDRIGRHLGIEQICDWRLYRLIVCRQRSIGQSSWDIEPTATFNVHREWVRTRMGIQSTPHWVSFGGGWLRFREVRNVGGNAMAVCGGAIIVFGVPPDVFLALGPRVAFRISRSTVIKNMAVGRPGKAPAQADIIVRITPTRQVYALFGHDAAENPDATCGAAIGFELGKIFDYLSISNGVAVNLLHDIFDDGFLQWSRAAIIPDQVLNRLVALLRTVLIAFLQAHTEFGQEPVL